MNFISEKTVQHECAHYATALCAAISENLDSSALTVDFAEFEDAAALNLNGLQFSDLARIHILQAGPVWDHFARHGTMPDTLLTGYSEDHLKIRALADQLGLDDGRLLEEQNFVSRSLRGSEKSLRKMAEHWLLRLFGLAPEQHAERQEPARALH